MYNRFDRIPACDRQTDRSTSCGGIVHAMYTRRAVKKLWFLSQEQGQAQQFSRARLQPKAELLNL